MRFIILPAPQQRLPTNLRHDPVFTCTPTPSVICRRGRVSAGALEDEADFSSFEVSVALTPAGVASWSTVVEHVYAAINVSRSGVTDETFNTLKAQDELAFRFKEKEEPSDYASDTSSNLQQYASKDVLVGPSVTSAFDKDVVTGVLDQLVPRSMVRAAHRSPPDHTLIRSPSCARRVPTS